MRSRLLHAVVVLATFVVVWLTARPAQAAAPRCDARGAITFAPPPVLQDPDSSIDIGVDGCGAVTPVESKHVAPGRSAPEEPQLSSHLLVAVTATPPAIDPPASHAYAPPVAVTAPRAGVRSTIERPPRA